MSHFSLNEMADFARGVTEESVRGVQERHLARCRDCAEAVELWRQVFAAACRDRSCQPPESLASEAMSLFPAAQPAGRGEEWMGLRRLVARLSFDSLSGALPVGVRSGRSDTRHLLCRAGSYCLDLRLDGDPGQSPVTVTGQVVDESAPDTPMAAVPVLLMSSNQVLGRTVSNEFGEFTLDVGPQRNLRLCLPLTKAGARIECSLHKLRAQTETQ